MNTVKCCFCEELIDKDIAIKYEGEGDEDLYFCSDDCVVDYEYENM